MQIPLHDVEVLEVDSEQLAIDFLNQQGGGLVQGLEVTMLKAFASWVFTQLNAKIAAANAAGHAVAK